METRPLPHKRLTEEEIKEKISSLCYELHLFKDRCLDNFSKMEYELYLLKRHFCPEKFHEMTVSMQDMSELMEKGYGQMNLGEPMRFKKHEEENDNPA